MKILAENKNNEIILYFQDKLPYFIIRRTYLTILTMMIKLVQKH